MRVDEALEGAAIRGLSGSEPPTSGGSVWTSERRGFEGAPVRASLVRNPQRWEVQFGSLNVSVFEGAPVRRGGEILLKFGSQCSSIAFL